jgi:outer membrane protein OmpA-like peptidoglycan-associated protein
MKHFLAASAIAASLILTAGNAGAHEYDRDDSDHPLRYVAYVLHPVGVAIEYVVLRPIHWFASRPVVHKIVGHEIGHDRDHVSKDQATIKTTASTESEQELPRDVPLEREKVSHADFPEMNVIYFDYNEFSIRADQLARVDENLLYLRNNPDAKVMIEGHCDERGTPEYNLNLGINRAKSVLQYFVSNGIDPGRITISSKGEESPAVEGHTENEWRLNRRDEFKRLVVIRTAE